MAQKAPAQQTIAVVVVDAHAQPPVPVPTVRVELDYLDGSVRVSESRDVTNPKGQAWLSVSQDVAQRGGLHIEIDGAKDLVIYQPRRRPIGSAARNHHGEYVAEGLARAAGAGAD